MQNTTTGSNNVAIGYGAMLSSTTGHNSVAVGFEALEDMTTAADNTAVGHSSGKNITTGYKNTAVGQNSLVSATTHYQNTAIGYDALHDCTGNNNTAVGFQAGQNITSGSNNVTIGWQSGTSLTTGSRSCIIGYLVNASGATIGDELVVHAGNATVTAFGNGTAFLGAHSAGGSAGAVYRSQNSSSWNTTSDERIKKDITDNTDGLSIINQIKVRNFKYRTEDEITVDSLKPYSRIDCGTGNHIGVIAQELETVAAQCVSDETTGLKSVDTDELFWIMLNAVKELSTKNTALETRVATLEAA